MSDDEKEAPKVDLESRSGYDTDVELYTPAENRRVLLKIDLIVLPLIVISMTLAFLDKNALSYAAVWGIKTDDHLIGQQYSWVATTFYFGYLIAEFPTLLILPRVRLGKYIGIIVFLWGGVVMAMGGAKDFAGLEVVRVFMGILEAGLLPCFMLLNAMWWRKNEQGLRTAFWFNTFAGIFGGIFAYAIGSTIHGALPVWKYIFIIYGCITCFVGALIIIILPDSPSTAWFLNAREKEVARLRTIENQTGVEVRGTAIKWEQVFEALRDPKYWVCMALGIAQAITNAGVSNFNPLIVSQFGWSTAKTTLMATPQAAVGIASQVILTFIASTFHIPRSILWILSTFPAIVGAALVHTLDPVVHWRAVLTGIYLMGFYNCGWVFAVSLATSNTAGRTKKGFVNISFAIVYAVGNIIGPQFFISSESPRYETGILAMLACFVIMGAMGIFYGLLCLYENRKRDRTGAETVEEKLAKGERVDNNESDLTDVQNELFRYSY